MQSRDKQQQAAMPSLIAMGAFEVTIDCDGRNQCHHCVTLKLSQKEPLERNKEGRGDQLRSHKWPCQQTQQEHLETVVTITTILTPQGQLLP